MADTSSTLCFSSFSASVPLSKAEPISFPSTSFTPRKICPQFLFPRSRSIQFTVKSSSGSSRFIGDDAFGSYPWENSDDAADSSIEWVTEEKVTLFTSDGLVQIGGNLVPRRISSADRFWRRQRNRLIDVPSYKLAEIICECPCSILGWSKISFSMIPSFLKLIFLLLIFRYDGKSEEQIVAPLLAFVHCWKLFCHCGSRGNTYYLPNSDVRVMENGPGLEDGTADVERLLVEPQDGHASMDSVICFNEKIPENNMNMADDSHSFGYHIPNDFCSMGEDYLLGFDFSESITHYEGLQTSVSSNPILASNAGDGTPWKSDPFRIMEVAENELRDLPSCQHEPETLNEEQPLKSPISCASQNIGSFNDISSCSFQDYENVASPSQSVDMLCPKTEKIDKFSFTGQDNVTKGQDVAIISGQTGLTESPPKQKRLRKPTQRYIDELSDPIVRCSKKRREVTSPTVKDKSLGVKDHKKCNTGYRAMKLPDEESSLKVIQVPFASLVHKESPPKSHDYDAAHSTDRANSMSKSKDIRFTPENQKKRDERPRFVHPKKSDEYIPASSQKKRDDHIRASSQKKRDNIITGSSQKKRDDWIISVSPKKNKPRVKAMSQKKRDDDDDDDDFLYEESPEEVSGRRKHHRLWTIAEVRKLIDGVSQHGVGRWSRIKKLFFSASPHRTSVDLKDKWRNLLKASGIKEQGDRQGEKKRNMAWRPLPKSILRRVCELATMHPYPKGRKLKIGHLNHDSPDRSTDITLSDYRKILRSINSS